MQARHDSRDLVSVVIPVFNGGRFLAEAIESVLGQTYGPVEAIVVDDGSTDDSAEVAGRFPEVQLVRQANSGTPAARNAGLREASGEFVALLDADDLATPDRFEQQVGHLLAHPETDIVLGRQELLIEPGVRPPEWVPKWGVHADRMAAQEVQPEGLPVDLERYAPNCWVARRACFDAVGPFDPRFRYADEVDWLLRAWEMNLETAFLEATVIRRRVHAGNLTHDTAACQGAMFRVFKARIDRRRARAAS